MSATERATGNEPNRAKPKLKHKTQDTRHKTQDSDLT